MGHPKRTFGSQLILSKTVLSRNNKVIQWGLKYQKCLVFKWLLGVSIWSQRFGNQTFGLRIPFYLMFCKKKPSSPSGLVYPKIWVLKGPDKRSVIKLILYIDVTERSQSWLGDVRLRGGFEI